jgi:hypothetical protein
MPRRTRRRYPLRTRSVRYSNETTSVTDVVAFGAGALNPAGFSLIPPALIQGVRKVKNCTLRVLSGPAPVPILWAIVYAPEGTLAANLVLAAGGMNAPLSLYEPNQNVMMSGVIETYLNQSSSIIAHSRLARNLQSGDSLVIIFSTAVANPAGIPWNWNFVLTFNYAITY